MIIQELILKVANICNLNCEYCYVFNKGDHTYKDGPRIISPEVINDTIMRISEHCKTHNLNNFVIIFHGGEPLLVDKEFYRLFVTRIKDELKGVDIGFGLQTNGTLLSQEWINLFTELGISFGISFDGTREASRFRVYRGNKKSSYDDTLKAFGLLQRMDYPINILSVINIEEVPNAIYTILKENKIQSVDFLFPDTNYDIDTSKEGEVGRWLVTMFDLWYNDKNEIKPNIRLFDMIVGLILGVERGNETLGRKHNPCLCIKPNGDIQAPDNLMICGDGFTKLGLNVNQNNFDEALNKDLMKKYYNAHQNQILCKECNKCTIKKICGGGHLAHRYSSSNGFLNPSIYCKDIFKLVAHIQNILVEDLLDNLEHKVDVKKLCLEDCV